MGHDTLWAPRKVWHKYKCIIIAIRDGDLVGGEVERGLNAKDKIIEI